MVNDGSDLCCLVLLCLLFDCNHINIRRDLCYVSNNTIKFGFGRVNKYGLVFISVLYCSDEYYQ